MNGLLMRPSRGIDVDRRFFFWRITSKDKRAGTIKSAIVFDLLLLINNYRRDIKEKWRNENILNSSKTDNKYLDNLDDTWGNKTIIKS